MFSSFPRKPPIGSTQRLQISWLRPVKSDANFVLNEVLGGLPADSVYQKLRDKGVLIRYFGTQGKGPSSNGCTNQPMLRPQRTPLPGPPHLPLPLPLPTPC